MTISPALPRECGNRLDASIHITLDSTIPIPPMAGPDETRSRVWDPGHLTGCRGEEGRGAASALDTFSHEDLVMHPKSSTVSANGVDLHLVEEGSGPIAIVFLHYWGGTSRTWGPVIDRLSGHHRCVAVDLRGWGKSGRTAGDFSLGVQASDVEAVIAELGLTDHVLVGHSMGGKIAQIVASRHPAGLRKLVLVAPAPPTPVLIPDREKKMRLASYRSEGGVEMALNRLAGRPLNGAHRRQVAEDTLGGQEEAKEAWVEQNMAVDISTAASAITVPVVVIVGGADRVETEEVLRREIPRFIRDVRFHILDGVGHLSPLEAPEEVASMISGVVWGQ